MFFTACVTGSRQMISPVAAFTSFRPSGISEFKFGTIQDINDARRDANGSTLSRPFSGDTLSNCVTSFQFVRGDF